MKKKNINTCGTLLTVLMTVQGGFTRYVLFIVTIQLPVGHSPLYLSSFLASTKEQVKEESDHTCYRVQTILADSGCIIPRLG